ncbi:unnamed protein product [Rhizophagus irregularis]|nr:unnamed protein product [Rhizophagus irregularis]CAB5207906.1 unnamed protein product [Rhizophagus irregularis]CAB5210227.1 unnamed protein product [Rhizophagus irregularis]
MPKTQNKRTSRTQITIGKGIISQEKTLPKRASLTLAQKHEICLKKVTEPSLKNKELAKLFDVSEGCISSTLKNSQKWLEIDPQAPEAKGEAASAPLEKLDEFRKELQDLIRGYSLDDVFNCDETGILPLDDTDSQDEIEENEREENERKEIQDLIDKLEYIHPLTAEEYIKLDQENEITGETLTEEQIVAILKENNSISDDESDREITSVSSSEVLAAFDKIFIYLEQNKSQDIIDKGAFKAMKKARREVYRNNFFSKKQMSLDLFVKTNDSVDGVYNNNMNRIGDKDNIMDVDNINFETLYFNEGDFYNHEECEGFIEYQIDQDSLYK